MDPTVASLLRFAGLIAAVVFLLDVHPAHAIVYRRNLTDQQVQDLAKQGQFAGTGYVNGGGSAVAIAPRWVMTARHVGAGFSNQGRQQFGSISAKLTGTNDVTKRGAANLLLTGDNSAFEGQLIVEEGTMIVNANENLGTSGFFSTNKTVVQDGATLQLRGAGLTADEHIHLSGMGFDNKGAIYISSGAHTLTQRIGIIEDAIINIDAGASLTIGVGDPTVVGGFYRQAGPDKIVTLSGEGTVVFDMVNNISGLSVINGVAAGDGGLNGTLSLTTGAELRPGDSASAMEFGEFNSSDFSMDGRSLKTASSGLENNCRQILRVGLARKQKSDTSISNVVLKTFRFHEVRSPKQAPERVRPMIHIGPESLSWSLIDENSNGAGPGCGLACLPFRCV